MEKIWTKERYEAYSDKNKPGRYKFDDKSVIVINSSINSIEYYYLGKLHREGGPAIEFISGGNRSWYKHGKLHRLDGPAKEYDPDGKYWFIDGKQYTEEEWKKLSFAILNNLESFL